MREVEREGLAALFLRDSVRLEDDPHKDFESSMDLSCEHPESPVEWEDRSARTDFTFVDFIFQPPARPSRPFLKHVFFGAKRSVQTKSRNVARIGATGTAEDIEETFHQLFERWQSETEASSWMSESALHPAYQRIIGLGPDVIPVLLRELSRRPAHLFWALCAITGENPVKPEDAGDISRMRAAWLEWGETMGLI